MKVVKEYEISFDETYVFLKEFAGLTNQRYEFVDLKRGDDGAVDKVDMGLMDLENSMIFAAVLGETGVAGSIVASCFTTLLLGFQSTYTLIGDNSYFSQFNPLTVIWFKKVDPNRFEFANERLLRGKKHLLRSISWKKPIPVHDDLPPQVHNSSVAACVEVGKFGLEEEVESLKWDKNALMQELVRLRQQ
ncbi:hypothetical protein POTOM_061552 [Populus tomentosa]|uniref:Uncharacterized protein n=1 Tax=Populus tomentosa TaxID=118781 RepID=A0A8X7XSY0_POPTO|nr:hypothetical protein POTOM_061552 [Populus tomentosa]